MSETNTESSPAGGEVRHPARAEHVGSLLRPQALLAKHAEVYEPGHTSLLEEERSKDLSGLRSLEDELIREAVRRQVDAGLDVVTDGEFRRALFVNSFYDAVDGIGPNPDGVIFRDGEGNRVRYAGAPMVTGRVRKRESPAAREAEFLASITDHPFKVTLPAGSWFLIPWFYVPGLTDRFYPTREEFAEAMLAIQRELIEDAVAAGARYVQLDYPLYPFLLDPLRDELLRPSGVSSDELLEQALDADRRIVEGLPEEVYVAVHLCRGNYRSKWLFEGALDPVAERFFALPYDKFLIEWEDTSRQGGYSALRHVPSGPTTAPLRRPVVTMGIVSSKHPRVESEDELLRLIDAASRYLELDQLALSPQCGFASGAEGNELSEDAQWRKLETVGRVAARLWNGD